MKRDTAMDKMQSHSGGGGAKEGIRYEDYWTITCILRVFAGDFDYIYIEPLSPDGFEFQLVNSSAVTQYHQVKKGHWTLSDLIRKRVIQNFWDAVREFGSECYLIVSSSSDELSTLAGRAEASEDFEEFTEHLDSKGRREDFDKILHSLSLTDGSKIFEFLKHITVRTLDLKGVKDIASADVREQLGVDTPDSKTIPEVLRELIYDYLHQRLTASEIRVRLEERKFIKPDHPPVKLDAKEVRVYLNQVINVLESSDGVLRYVELQTKTKTRNIDTKNNAPAPTLSIVNRENEKRQTGKLANIDEAASRFSRFVLVGEPGAGKTTAVREFALRMARNCLKNIGNYHEYPIPIYIELSKWSDKEQTIQEFVQAQVEQITDSLGMSVVKILHRKGAILLLDGLNEMGKTGRQKTNEIYNWFYGLNDSGKRQTEILPPRHIIVTCRKEDYYRTNVQDLELPIIEAKPLDETRITKFAQNYLGDKAEFFLDQVFREKRKSLLSLARNPYRLVILIGLYQDAAGELPTNTGALFREMVRLLWKTEEEKNSEPEISYQQIVDSLSHLAFAMIDADMSVSVSRRYAQFYVYNSRILEVSNNIFIKMTDKEVRFDHQLTQEYFAAEALDQVGIEHVQLSYPTRVEKESKGLFSLTEKIRFRLSDKWNQVVIALCGIVDQPENIIRYVASINPFLAQECMQSGIEIEDLDLFPSFIDALDDSNINIVAKAIEALGKSEDERAVQYITSFVHHENEALERVAKDALVNLGELSVPYLVGQLQPRGKTLVDNDVLLVRIGDPSVNYLSSELASASVKKRSLIYHILGSIGSQNSVEVLKNSALSEVSTQAKKAAIKALGVTEHTEAVQFLIEILRFEEEVLRVEIVKSLTRIVNSVSRSAFGKKKLVASKSQGKNGNLQLLIFNGVKSYFENENSDKVLEQIAVLLKYIIDPAALEYLIILFHSNHWNVHKAAFNGLEEMAETNVRGKTRAKNLYTRFTAINNSRWRHNALDEIYERFDAIGFLYALKHATNSDAMWDIARRLADVLQDLEEDIILHELGSDNRYRSSKGYIAYAVGLGEHGNFANELMPLLNHSYSFVRGQAIRSLGWLEYKPAVQAIGSLLSDTEEIYSNMDTQVRAYAEKALKNIDTEKARDILESHEREN